MCRILCFLIFSVGPLTLGPSVVRPVIFLPAGEKTQFATKVPFYWDPHILLLNTSFHDRKQDCCCCSCSPAYGHGMMCSIIIYFYAYFGFYTHMTYLYGYFGDLSEFLQVFKTFKRIFIIEIEKNQINISKM